MFGSFYLSKVTTAARAVLPITASACRIFVFLNNGMDARLWDFNGCADVDVCDRTVTRGLCERRKRVCTENWLWVKTTKIEKGIEPSYSACHFGPTLCHANVPYPAQVINKMISRLSSLPKQRGVQQI